MTSIPDRETGKESPFPPPYDSENSLETMAPYSCLTDIYIQYTGYSRISQAHKRNPWFGAVVESQVQALYARHSRT